MASKRKLKKAINFVTNEIVLEIYVLSFFKEIKEEKLDVLVDKTLDIRDEFIKRINHVDGKKDSKIVKSYFNNIREEWGKSIDELVKEVESL